MTKKEAYVKYNKSDKGKARNKKRNQTPARKAWNRQRMLFNDNPLEAVRRLANILNRQGAIHEEISNSNKG